MKTRIAIVVLVAGAALLCLTKRVSAKTVITTGTPPPAASLNQ